MNRAFRQMLAVTLMGCFPVAAMAGGASVTMQVVEINGSSAGLPSTDVNVDPGDILRIEVFVENWAPDALAGYQFEVPPASLASGQGDPLAPPAVACTTDDDCNDTSSCLPSGFCDCAGQGVLIDDTADDYVFQGLVDLPIPACFEDGTLRAGSLVFVGSVSDTGSAGYLGEFLLDTTTACGTYTLSFNGPETFLLMPSQDQIPISSMGTATVNVSGECGAGSGCMSFEAFPANCEVDAHQPTDINDAGIVFGIDTFELTFNEAECDPSLLGVDDFSVFQTPGLFPLPPAVASVTPTGPDSVAVQLDGPINVGKWTCLTLETTTGGLQQTCLGYQPADVSGDGTSAANDILALIDSLNGVIPRPDFATDADRSGLPGAPDILRVIDLLNGASVFDEWLGLSLPACPSE